MSTPLNFYRTESALQVNFSPAKMKTGDTMTFLDDIGTIFFEMTSGKNRTYDWKEKIIFAVGISDLPALFEAYDSFNKTGKVDVSLTHDPGAGTDKAKKVFKTLQIVNGKKDGTFYVVLESKSNDKQLRHFVSFRAGELILLMEAIKQSLPYLLGTNKL